MDKLLNKLHFENCKNILQQLPDGSVDMFLQDPPFEVTNCEWDTGFIETLPEMWQLWQQKGKANCPFLFKATFPFANDLINSRPKGMKYYEWLWEKNVFSNFVNAKIMPMRAVEYIFVFYKNQPTYNPIQRKNKHPKATIKLDKNYKCSIYNVHSVDYVKEASEFGAPINLIKVSAEKSRFVSTGTQNRHANRTNPELWEYFIKTYTNEGDVVFDGYSGSGSIPEACISTNRNFVACENNAKEFERATVNIQNAKDIKQHGYAKQALVSDKNTLFFGVAL